jgi:hypothetical protein
MTEAKHYRLFLSGITLLCAMCGLSMGQQGSGPKSESGAVPQSANVTRVDSSPPTLEELKSAGALKSTFRKQRLVSNHLVPQGTETPQPQLAAFKKDVEPVLQKACVQCHGPDEQQGNLRIDRLNPDLLHGNDVHWWLEIFAVLSKGEMPPAGEDELADAERSKVVEWLISEIQVASTVRRAEQGHSSFRRMTRYEYSYALQDLLGLAYDFGKDLPPEPASEEGFLNSSEMLHMPAIQFETYRELSRVALKKATVQGERPALTYWGVTMEAASAVEWAQQDKQLEKLRQDLKDNPEKLQQELKQRTAGFYSPHGGARYQNLKTGRNAGASWSYPAAKYAWKPSPTPPEVPPLSDYVAILPPKQRLIVELGDTVPDAGMLRVRIRASRTSADEQRIPSLQLEFGWQSTNDSEASVKISDLEIPIDATPAEPKFYAWDIPLSEIYPRNSMRNIWKMGDLPSPSEYVKFVNSSVSQGNIQIDYVEITAPVYEQWPPQSHTRIFMESENQADEAIYAREVLTKFMSRAWRRTLTDVEVNQKLALFTKIRPACDHIQDAMIEVLATVISAPQFLYLVRADPPPRAGEPANTERLSEFELATRLSMFLWCSTPDDELLKLATDQKLSNRDVLSKQVNRLLADPRSQRFSKQFVRQWLGMQLLDYLHVNQKTYPQFDPALKAAMQYEPVAFFNEVLQKNHSILDFIHSDYTMANERLAVHYGLSDVYGNDFRRVTLAPGPSRGGLLTQAGLLAMNSDGQDSHPLKRGIWVLKQVLNDPPPPPPPAVPVIDLADPEILKLTLKQRIENHRNKAACMSCHAKIDPWGIAFENFDAVGSWRTEIQGKAVDASSLLFNSQKLDGIDGLKRYLLEHRQDQFASAMVHKLTTYALGRPLTFGDRSRIDGITAESRIQGDGLATMVKLIVASELFQSK